MVGPVPPNECQSKTIQMPGTMLIKEFHPLITCQGVVTRMELPFRVLCTFSDVYVEELAQMVLKCSQAWRRDDVS